LFQDGQEIDIDHAGSVYRLRITSLGKLILTK
jgi:hemin uptake protein HemP